MATERVPVTWTLLALLLIPAWTAAEFPEADRIRTAGRTLQSALLQLLEFNTANDVIQRDYRSKTETKFSQPLHGSQIVQSMADQLSKSFANKVAALRRLKGRAEEAVRDYKYNASLRLSDVKYINMKELNINLEYSTKFQREVNFSTSGVHIPIEIFEEYPEILNGLKFSESLDEVFKHNNPENDPQLTWQFFGSKIGFMRVYPVNKWNEIPHVLDMYDVRRRPWYIQGSTSPKDMLILIDTSGSVHGQTFSIMKQSVKTLLNTLEENDYVNVAWFSGNAGWVTCFTHFVQANSWNKKALFEGIDELTDGGMSSYANALEFAFQAFKNFSLEKRDYQGAECHQVIMMFTDGGTDRPEDVLKAYNSEKKIRVFTYAVGPHAIPVNAVKWMACENRGYYSTISAMGAVRTKIQEYPNVLVRPMALNDSQTETYSSVYTDAGGLGMVITVTLPVYNQSEGSGNQSSVGVVGIDTPVTNIESQLPHYKTGPNSYAFAINHNGFVLLHPKMKPQKTYMEDDPDIDFLDLEPDDSQSQKPYFASLRKEMIDEKTGNQQFVTHINSGDPHHVVLKNVTYHFTPIKDTSMSLGIVIPDDRKGYLSITEKARDLNVNLETEGVLIAPWKYCSGLQTTSDMRTFIKELKKAIKENPKSCNEELINRLAWDIDVTRMMQTILTISNNNNKTSKWAGVFVGTEGGLTRFFPKSEEENLMKIRDPFQVTYFKKALHYPTWTFMVSNEFSHNEASPVVTAVKPISIDINGIEHKPAVHGVRLYETAILDLMKAFLNDIQPENDGSEVLVSYMLDDGGYIVAYLNEESEHNQHVGKFLGLVDPPLMAELNSSVYKRWLEYDYHAICPREETHVSAAPYHIPSISTLFRKGLHLASDIVLWLLTVSWTAMGSGLEVSAELPTTIRITNYTCTKQRTLYYFTPVNEIGPNPVEGEILCGNCTRNYAAMRLLKTNLLLITVTQNKECPFSWCNEGQQFDFKNEEVIIRNSCEEDKQLRYRRRPSTCYAFHPLEDFSECGACSLSRCLPLLMAVTVLSLLLRKFLSF